MTFDRWFGGRVRAERERQGISQRQLANDLYMSFEIPLHQTGVSKIESGERAVRLEEAVGIASVLGMPLGALVYGVDAASVPGYERAVAELIAMERFIQERRALLVDPRDPPETPETPEMI